MKTKFTKGEWIADLRGGCCAVYPKHTEDETNGCHFYDSRNIFFSSKGASYDPRKGCWSMSEEEQANAKLIAAAPDLLNSLISLKERIDYLICTGIVDINKMETIVDINIANDAIKKATE